MSGIKQPFACDPPEHVMWFKGQVTGHATTHAALSVPMGPISIENIKNTYLVMDKRFRTHLCLGCKYLALGNFQFVPQDRSCNHLDKELLGILSHSLLQLLL